MEDLSRLAQLLLAPGPLEESSDEAAEGEGEARERQTPDAAQEQAPPQQTQRLSKLFEDAYRRAKQNDQTLRHLHAQTSEQPPAGADSVAPPPLDAPRVPSPLHLAPRADGAGCGAAHASDALIAGGDGASRAQCVGPAGASDEERLAASERECAALRLVVRRLRDERNAAHRCGASAAEAVERQLAAWKLRKAEAEARAEVLLAENGDMRYKLARAPEMLEGVEDSLYAELALEADAALADLHRRNRKEAAALRAAVRAALAGQPAAAAADAGDAGGGGCDRARAAEAGRRVDELLAEIAEIRAENEDLMRQLGQCWAEDAAGC